jgi:hypothetical protein
MYYKPSISADCTSMLQSLRACGNFDDNMPITIHTYDWTRKCIEQANEIQEDIIGGLLKLDEEKELMRVVDFTRGHRIDKSDMPKKALTKRWKDTKNIVGRDEEGRGGKSLSDEEQVQKIHKMLKQRNNTNISTLLSIVDIRKEYTKRDIFELLSLSNYKHPGGIWNNLIKLDSQWGPGCIFEKTNDGLWSIRQEIRRAWLV